MRGSQQSSRCSAIWNVMKRSRYMWLGRCGRSERQDEQTHATMHTEDKLYTENQVHIPTRWWKKKTSYQPLAQQKPVVTNTCYAETRKPPTLLLRRQTYTVLLSCLISLEENSLRISKKARLRGGPPSPWGLGSLNANSMPSLEGAQREVEQDNEQNTRAWFKWVKITNLVTN